MTVAHARAVGGVVRVDGMAWLTDDVERGACSGLDGGRATVMQPSLDETLQGGLLPPGAVAAHVIDDAGARRAAACANGAWVVLLERECAGRVSPVCFTDADGGLIAPELAVGWPRTPVADADEPCPACGEIGWDEVVASDGSRGMHGVDMRPAPFVRCRACGHEESIGIYAVAESGGPEPDDAEHARLVQAARARVRRDARDALEGLRFPVYALRDRPGRIDGWGSSNGVTSQITVAHGARPGDPGPQLRIMTEQERHAYESELARARSALAGALMEDLGPCPEDRSHAALAVWLHVREREHLRRAAQAQVEQRTFLVDDDAVPFVFVASGNRWVAVARRGDLTITIAARDVEPVGIELSAVRDPLAALDDPDPF